MLFVRVKTRLLDIAFIWSGQSIVAYLTCDTLLLQMGLQGPLGQLQRGVSDVVSEVEVINEDDVRQRWTATSAELWPVRLAL